MAVGLGVTFRFVTQGESHDFLLLFFLQRVLKTVFLLATGYKLQENRHDLRLNKVNNVF